eukprot:TRINITY_DN11596_c0_g1_i2.p1 TRINITY_DN11596_c0_g1~~TRINITY_DN11596_c0_g1_i2.p1  ORF type:complete len:112 (-),score=9.71 TRINITY_DN11596_c0_g1_i2:1-336(-)
MSVFADLPQPKRSNTFQGKKSYKKKAPVPCHYGLGCRTRLDHTYHFQNFSHPESHPIHNTGNFPICPPSSTEINIAKNQSNTQDEIKSTIATVTTTPVSYTHLTLPTKRIV